MMNRGWRYRLVSVSGTIILTGLAVVVANLQSVQTLFAQVPYVGRPAPEVLPSGELTVAIVTTVVVVLGLMWPLFKPRSRRILDTIVLTQKRVLIAMLGLAAIGYFNYSYRLPRSTLMITTALLFVFLPSFMVAIRQRPRSGSRAVIVGDDPEKMSALLAASNTPIIGYISTLSVYQPANKPEDRFAIRTDGGPATNLDDLRCLGGLSQLEELIQEHNIDTVLLAFHKPDRENFFGTLETCHDNGVKTLLHREYADSILVDNTVGEELLEANIEPWDWQDHILKRLFDVSFAGVMLLLATPVIVAVSIAIKLEDGGPILYRQQRTAEFGGHFTIAKFRSMIPDAESKTGAKISDEDAGGVDPRVTRVGRIIRKTHIDEIPQLWSILIGDMSVVGPRPERPELDSKIQQGVSDWRRRWFVKPGLTGLAQINGATGAEPAEKLRYDVAYIRQQSFWFDLKIVLRQLWQVGTDLLAFTVSGDAMEKEGVGEASETEGESTGQAKAESETSAEQKASRPPQD